MQIPNINQQHQKMFTEQSQWKHWTIQSVDNYHTRDTTPTKRFPLINLRGAEHLRRQQPPHPSFNKLIKTFEVENLMTLKQAYPPEYQRVQGAFKDSMIH